MSLAMLVNVRQPQPQHHDRDEVLRLRHSEDEAALSSSSAYSDDDLRAAAVMGAMSIPRGPHRICPHGKRRTRCRDCGGGSICTHGKRRDMCCECAADPAASRVSRGRHSRQRPAALARADLCPTVTAFRQNAALRREGARTPHRAHLARAVPAPVSADDGRDGDEPSSSLSSSPPPPSSAPPPSSSALSEDKLRAMVMAAAASASAVPFGPLAGLLVEPRPSGASEERTSGASEERLSAALRGDQDDDDRAAASSCPSEQVAPHAHAAGGGGRKPDDPETHAAAKKARAIPVALGSGDGAAEEPPATALPSPS